MNLSWYYISGILILAGINLMAVQGLSLLTGFTGLFSFGHAGFMSIGAYTAAIMASWLGMPFYVSLLAAGLTAGLISLIIGRLTLKLKGDYFVIATLGFGESVRLLFAWLEPIGGARGFTIPGSVHYTSLFDVILINIIGLIIIVNLINSKHGRNFKAIREEELASSVIGIDVFKYKMSSFFISAVYAGIAGGMFAHYLHFIQPIMFQLIKSTELTIMVIFGGLGSITGSVIGAILLTSLPEFLRFLDVWRFVIYGALVVLIMILRPKGLMGGHELRLVTWVKRLFSAVRKGGKA